MNLYRFFKTNDSVLFIIISRIFVQVDSYFNLIFLADKNISDLSNIPTVVQGDNGVNGSIDDCHGANADHLYLQVIMYAYQSTF